MRYTHLLIMLLFFAGSSCKKDKSQSEIDEEVIVNYLKDNNLEALRHASGLYYIINEPGTGGSPTYYSIITAKYKGYLINGTVFDETTGDETLKINLNQVIEGWQLGIPLLKRGGKGTFLIPSELGYGNYNSGSIPANSVLIFEIELIDFR